MGIDELPLHLHLVADDDRIISEDVMLETSYPVPVQDPFMVRRD